MGLSAKKGFRHGTQIPARPLSCYHREVLWTQAVTGKMWLQVFLRHWQCPKSRIYRGKGGKAPEVIWCREPQVYFQLFLKHKTKLLGLFNMVLKSSDSVTMFFAAQETLEQKFSSHFGRMEFFYCLVEKTKQNLCWPLILEERSEWDMGPPDCEGVTSTPTVPWDVHKLPELTLNASTDYIWKHQGHVCSLVNTRSFCPRNLHVNETLGFYLQPVANWYDIGHPVLSPRTPKVSSFHPCMAFYTTTVLRFWCIYKMPEIFT